MFSHGFPYTNFHDLNLDWIIKTVKILFNKSVFSINNVEPDDDGNVTITGEELGAIGTVNNIAPVDGNVTLTASDVGAIAQGVGVTKVNGFSPDSSGNVLSGTVRSINGISPASLPTPGNVVLNASDVGALPSTIDPVETVNGISPDANGNVNVGTVKSVNGSTPDAQGNINLPTVAGVTSVDGIGPDAQGNVETGLKAVKQIYVNSSTGDDTNDGAQATPFKTITKALETVKALNFRGNNSVVVINIANGTYAEVLDCRRIPIPMQFSFSENVTIGGFVLINCECKIHIPTNATLKIKRFSSIAYPFGKYLIYIQEYGMPKFEWSANLELICDDSTYGGLNIDTTDKMYLQHITFTGSFRYPIQLKTGAEFDCDSITAPTTNIGILEHCSTLRTSSINGGTSYEGTTISSGSKIVIT